MRIAVVSNTSWYLFNFRLNLMLALQAAGHTVIAIAPDDAYAARIRAAGIVCEHVAISGGGTNPLIELRSLIALWRLLRHQKIALVLSYTPKGNLYSALASITLGLPFIPNVSGLGRAFIKKSMVTQVAKLLYRLTFRRARHVFFQNLDDMAVFVDSGLVLAAQAERLPGSGVDLTRFTLASSFADSGAGALTDVHRQSTPKMPVFLLVARMLWDKGVGEYVTAARQVRVLQPGARFQLLGFVDVANPSAVSRAQVDTWVAEGVVEYFGPTDDVRPFLAQADCVVLPSYREGVPRTLLEAAAMARPVITTDAPGCRDTIIDGETGLLCRPANAQDLTEKIMHFISLGATQQQAMGQRGRAFVETYFDEKLVLKRYLDVVQGVATQ